MRFNSYVLAALSAGAIGVFAQMGQVSPQCENAVASVLTSNDATCLNPAGLAGIFTADPNADLAAPVDAWLKGLCSIPACTNSSLAAVVNGIFNGCKTELAGLNVTSADAVTFIQSVYPTFRQIVCLKDTRDGQLCLTQTFKNVETVTGPITLGNLGTVLNGVFSGNTAIPKNVICTDCNKATFTIEKKNLPSLVSPDEQKNLSNTCGASFVDGTTPSTVSQTAV